MKKKFAIIVLFFFIITYFLNSCAFAYTDTTVQQDLYYYAYQDTLVVQNLFQRSQIKSSNDLYNYISNKYPDVGVVRGDFQYFGILHNDINNYDVIFYNNNSLSNSSVVNDYNYFGIITLGFTLTNYVVVRMSSISSQDNKFISSVSKRSNTTTLPSIYYTNSREILFSHIEDGLDYSTILNSINDNITGLRDDINSNSETQQETQNFIKSNNEVSDNTIGSFNSDINVDSVDGTASTNIFDLFGIIDSQNNVQKTSIPINFSFFGQNMSFTIEPTLTNNFLYSVLGNTAGNLLTNAIRLIWTYFIFIFIVKNILSLIDKIKAGEVDKINTHNVLVDVL